MCEKHQHETPLAPTTEATVTEAPASNCCGGHSATAAPVVSPVATPADGADDVAECPVMPGSVVNKADAEAAGIFRDYNGQRYWFCCAGCGPAFDADPAKYATAA